MFPVDVRQLSLIFQAPCVAVPVLHATPTGRHQNSLMTEDHAFVLVISRTDITSSRSSSRNQIKSTETTTCTTYRTSTSKHNCCTEVLLL